jgi:hypothetical protein
MLLRYEERVEVPEARLDEPVGRHLREAGRMTKVSHVSIYANKGQDSPHFEEDVPELLAHLHQRMKRSSVRWCSLGVKVVLLEGRFLPRATVHSAYQPREATRLRTTDARVEELNGEIRLKLLNRRAELGALLD